MKRYIGFAVAIVVGTGLCWAQNVANPGPRGSGDDFDMQDAGPWHVSLGLIYKNWLYEHDALQQRVPTTSDLANEWEQGDTDGSGWGLQARIGRGDGKLNVTFMKSDFEFVLITPAGARWGSSTNGSQHTVDTIAREFELSWSQIRGRNNQAEWGSTLGFRYLGMQKDVTVREGTNTVSGSGNMNWLMVFGGYDGRWRPFGTPTLQAHGSIYFFLGEVEGTARSGADEDWTDGIVSETYGNEYSLAYGARALFGVDVAITRDVRLTVDYMREWLYSFDATDTGIVVFPDNNDALFIENHHAVVANLNYRF